jgi:hypothetical protein
MADSTAAMAPTGSVPEGPSLTMTYGRSRLLLGISGVGTWVVLATVALMAGLPGWLTRVTQGSFGADALAVGLLAFMVILVQAPFDLVGGYRLPQRYGRSSERFAEYAGRWLRGVAAYQVTYVLIGSLLLIASRGFGVLGMVLLGVASSILLLALRLPLACLVGGLQRSGPDRAVGGDAAVAASSDIGFTGGVEGVFRARRQIVPRRWVESLSPEMLSLAVRRRREAVASGLWLRGRVASLAFTWVGLAVAGSQVSGLEGTSGGVVKFAAVFTLWSFLGLLVLPTLSRRASMMIDRRLAGQGVEMGEMSTLAASLDSMQDDEPSRSKWIERIFHPIPSVTSPRDDLRSLRLAAWDAARTSAYLGMSGLSPLGRAVHCNSGRPALWIYLPSD